MKTLNKFIIFAIALVFSAFITKDSDSLNPPSKMKAIIHTPTNNPENSIAFYQKLGFKRIDDKKLIFTDGKAIIEINPERTARAGIKLFKSSWTNELEKIKSLSSVSKTDDGYLLSDLNNTWIYLIESEFPINYQLQDTSFSELGNLAGMTLECPDIKKSLAIYLALGFSVKQGDSEKGFVSLANDDKFGITLLGPLMCPHLFFNPSLTYFNGKIRNPQIIEKIRSLNIPIAEEITHFNKEGIVDNIIIRDPGGYGFFIFND